jgi:alpha-amylase/alpha-mannosidase (GH57 family)
MHQPWYLDPAGERLLLPWVRLHAISAYTDMAEQLLRAPDLRVTVSASPSLLDQVQLYIEETRDTYELITMRPADELAMEERQFLVRHFFSVNWERVIQEIPTYRALLEKRGREIPEGGWNEAAEGFTTDELRDLQVLFNLAWFGFSSSADPVLSKLREQGMGFTEDDKTTVLAKQRAVMKELYSSWNKLIESGSVEVICSPYYHGILPLLVDSNTAKRANPEVYLPERFSFPQDAAAQIRGSVERIQQVFGVRPRGMWPSEGAISPEVVQLAEQAELQYLVTDAELLFHSLDDRGGTPGRRRLYQPYRVDNCAIFFRDNQLSNRIATEYSSWDDSQAAARDLIQRVIQIGDRARIDGDAPPLVVIALDGENPWEAYPHRGHDFLDALHQQLASSEENGEIKTVTLSEHLAEHPPAVSLDYLHSGSRIETNFDMWIGEPEKNRAWSLLGRARQKLAREQLSAELPEETLEQALEHVHRAQCSDWFWWLGEPFSSAEDSTYDSLFRGQLMAMYRSLGHSPPADLSRPIGQGGIVTPLRQPTSYIHPRIDGTRTSYFEWRGAGFYRVKACGPIDQYHPSDAELEETGPFITGFYWGFDAGRLFLRLDPVETYPEGTQVLRDLDVWFVLTEAERVIEVRLALVPQRIHLSVCRNGGERQDLGLVEEMAYRDVVELAIPLSRLDLQPGTRLGLTVHFGRQDRPLCKVPYQGVIEVEVPGDDFGEA